MKSHFREVKIEDGNCWEAGRDVQAPQEDFYINKTEKLLEVN